MKNSNVLYLSSILVLTLIVCPFLGGTCVKEGFLTDDDLTQLIFKFTPPSNISENDINSQLQNILNIVYKFSPSSPEQQKVVLSSGSNVRARVVQDPQTNKYAILLELPIGRNSDGSTSYVPLPIGSDNANSSNLLTSAVFELKFGFGPKPEPVLFAKISQLNNNKYQITIQSAAPNNPLQLIFIGNVNENKLYVNDVDVGIMSLEQRKKEYQSKMIDYEAAYASYIKQIHSDTNDYIIPVCTGTDGFLYYYDYNSSSFVKVNDNTSGSGYKSISTSYDQLGLIGISKSDNSTYVKSNFMANWIGPTPTNSVSSISVTQNNTLVGVGKNGQLVVKNDINSPEQWSNATNPSEAESILSVAVASDDSIYMLSSNSSIYKKYSSLDLQGQKWEYVCSGSINGVNFSFITIGFDDSVYAIGTNGNLYKGNGTFYDLGNTSWTVINSNIKLTSVAIVYDMPNKQSSASNGSAQDKLLLLNSLNQQLLSLNDSIRSNIGEFMNPRIQNNKQVLGINGGILTGSYMKLLEQRKNITNLMKHYNDVNQNNNELAVQADKSNYNYTIWLTIAIVTIVLTIKYVAFPESGGTVIGIILWAVFILSLVFATINMSSPVGVVIWLILIIGVLMMKTKLIPSI